MQSSCPLYLYVSGRTSCWIRTFSALRMINSLLGKRRDCDWLTREILPVKVKVLLSGCLICCERWPEWSAGEEASAQKLLFSDVQTAFGFNPDTCQKRLGSIKLLQMEVANVGKWCFIVSSAPSVQDLARISMENKWKCAELGAHSVQAPCSQSKAAVLFCTIQLEWGDRLRHQLSYLQWGGRALCLKKGRRSQSRAGHARPSSLHIMSLFRNIHEEIPCLYFNFFQFYWEVIDIPIEARGDRVMISFIHGVKWWPH